MESIKLVCYRLHTVPELLWFRQEPRRQPELSEAVAYSPEPEHPASDLSLLDDDDLPPVLPGQLDPAMQRVARLASLNPDDGIQL